MAFRFVHTADIHLDSPLHSLSLRDPEIAQLIGNATRQSFAKIIDLCLDEAVDALMIAGDLYDRDLHSMKTAAFITGEMRRLDAAGIKVFLIRGNHDAGSVITRHLSFPDNVHAFTGHAEAIPVEGSDVVVHGVSFANRHVPESLLPKYKRPVGGKINVGLLHTSLAGSSRHDVYAPCGLADLVGHGFDYWGLGHIHQREVHAERPTSVVMPGIPQGRHINEAGSKSVTLVRIDDNGRVTMEERHTAIAQFERVVMSLAGVEDWGQVLKRMERALGEAVDAAKCDHVVARLSIGGATPLASRLRRDEDLLLEEARLSVGVPGKAFIETIDLRVRAPDRARPADGDDPLTELRTLMGDESGNRASLRKAAREMIEDLQRQLPVELRDRFGDSEEGLMALADGFIEEGTETLLARFEADRDGAVMRLRRFDLTRYGRFTDYSIDFGAPRPGMPDFHIVYGANEAGKSTVRNAFLDFLFGIEKQSAYNFLHPYGTMRIGGTIEATDGAHDLIRVKKDRNDLLGADERPVAEDFFSALLGAIDRSGYETMFSLDDDSLQAGGESILKSEGDLGRLLFSAASGLSELGDVVDAVRNEASEFYRPRGRGHDLAKAKLRLKELKDRIAEIDVLAKDYAALTTAAATARELYRRGVEEQDEARKSFERLRKITDALPLWRDLETMRQRFEPLASMPDLPEGWLAEAQELSRREAAAMAERDGLQNRVDTLKGDLDGIVPDAAILAVEADFARLKLQNLEARYISAEDIAARQRDCANVERDLAGLLQRLGRDPNSDPAEILLPAPTVGVLNDLLDDRPALATARDSAEEEVDVARARAQTAAQALSVCGDKGEDPAFAALVMKVREAAHDREIAGLVRQRDKAALDLEDALQTLAPWTGDAEMLARLPVPDAARIADWKQRSGVLRAEAADLDREIADRKDDQARLTADLAAHSLGTGDFDDDTAGRARKARDEAWALHRSSLARLGDGAGPVDLEGLAASADRFETSMISDDKIALARFERASDIVTTRHARAELVRCETGLAALERKRVALEARREAWAAETEAAMKTLHFPAETQVDFLETWLQRRAAALARQAGLAGIERDLSLAISARGESARRLCESLAGADVPIDGTKPLEDVLAIAQSHVDGMRQAEANARAARTAVEEANRDLADRERVLQRATRKLQAWADAWAEALEGTWLAHAGCKGAPAGMREILACLADISGKLERRDELKHRIVAMAEDRKAFEAAIGALAARTGTAFVAADTLAIADGLEKRLTEARRLKTRAEEKWQELEKASEDLRHAGEALDRIKARFENMAGLFPSDGFTALVRNLERSRDKARLQETIAGKERDLMAILEVGSIADVEGLVGDLADNEPALADLKAERARAEQTLADLENHVRGLFHEFKSADKAVASVDGDAAAARLEEERQTLLLDIEAQAQRYLGFSIGAMVAEQALRTYRDRHRNSMMRRAAAAFATITRGGFSDLITTPGRQSEILVGVRGDGGSLEASMMSKGTRFQLYLALRIAGYSEFAERRTALPFFADDIMETFDDDRSAETFQLLGDMAKIGQVIYLTHHRHLCDIARRVAGGGVRIHALPDPGPSAPDRD